MLIFLSYLKTTFLKNNSDIQPLAICQMKIDLIGPLPNNRDSASFATFTIDYFTK